MKHRIKTLLRAVIARVFHVTGLRAWFRRRRGGVPVLMFHNVGSPEATAYLPSHMKIAEERLERLIGLLRRGGYRTLTMGQMVAAFEDGATPDDAVVLTFDDGYRDNHDLLLPILQRHDATATVFVQTGPIKGRLNWLHRYFWVLHRIGPHALGERLAAKVDDDDLRRRLSSLPAGDVAGEYELKRLFKYDIPDAARDAVIDSVYAELGGDDRQLAAAVYLDPETCRALDRAGVEIGAHTENHLVLSSLDAAEQRREIESSMRDLEAWLGHPVVSFAYPYGRSWDYDEATLDILGSLGLRGAITAMTGVNDVETPRLQLKRYAVNDDSSLAEVMCDVDGVFAWFARHGLDLAT